MRIDPDRLREARLRRAWTQEQLAAVAGLGLRTVQRIERSGQASPESVQALAAVLELVPAELLPAAPASDDPPPSADAAGASAAPLMPPGSASSALPSSAFLPSGPPWEVPARSENGPAVLRMAGRAELGGRPASPARRRLLNAGALLLSAGAGLFLGRVASAQQLQLDVDLTVADQSVPTSRLLVEPGETAEIRRDGLFRVELIPSLLDEQIFLRARLFRYESARYMLVAAPRLIMAPGKPAEIRFGEEGPAHYAMRVIATLK